MKHRATPEFWRLYRRLPSKVRQVADKNFALLKSVGRFRSVCVGLRHRALAVELGEDLLWFLIGSHAEYDRIISTP